MEPTQPRRNPLPYLIGGALLLLLLLVKWCNTPHQDSSEKPLPSKQEKLLQKQRDQALKRADSLLVVADTAVAHSREAYALGVQARKEAAALRLETHPKPTPHAQVPTPASAKQLQQFFNEY
jgi:hypothetical protein